jgi:Arc/MetJ family transcription regulator
LRAIAPMPGAPEVLVYTIHMKRTNLVLDEQLLEEATALSGERTFSRTVERALEEMVKRLKARRMLELGGSGIWSGDLSAMRGDAGATFESGSASRQGAARERPSIYRPRAKKR